MSKLYRTIVWFIIVVFIVSCSGLSAMPEVSIARHPEPANLSGFHVYTELPAFDPTSMEPFQVDLRSSDLTELDLSKSGDNLLYASFDSRTQWPTSDKMPPDFDWQPIMETGKDPGLGMRALHAEGITGKGVGIAIIDGTLLVDHIEYLNQIRVYEEPEPIDRGMYARMHGPAVASIAVGKSVGVAPEADLYYIAVDSCFGFDADFACTARSVRRIIEINSGLPADRKIRVLSMSVGWGPQSKGYEEFAVALNEAQAAGIFVISSTLAQTDGWRFIGLGRNSSLADPNNFQSYEPAMPWLDYFYQNRFPANTLWVPMDSRTAASPTGISDYAFYREGGISWSIPYLAGMYALAVQVKPDITPEQFWETALQTGRTIQLQHDGKDYELGVILDPRALIEEIKSK